jgi:hypothetical protein
VAALGTFLESSWPRAAVVKECAAQRPGGWSFNEQRTTTGGVVVAPPTSRGHSKSMVRWSHRDGELVGEAFAMGGPNWSRALANALWSAPHGVADELRKAYRLAGSPEVSATRVTFRAGEGEFAVEDPAGPRPTNTGAAPSA